jgi:hypothetical protein
MRLRWTPESKEVACAAAWYRKELNRKIRGPRLTSLANAFWAGEWLVIVQVNPRRFPDPVSSETRRLITEECRLTGAYKPVELVWVRSEASGEPRVVKGKTLKGHISHVSQIPSKPEVSEPTEPPDKTANSS